MRSVPFRHWTPPDGAISALDISPVGTPDGVGFFAFPSPMANPTGYTAFGDGTKLDGYLMTGAERTAWRNVTGIAPPAGTLLDALWDLVTVDADPHGTARAKPLIPTHAGDLELWLGGHSKVRSRKFTGETDPAWANVRGVIQRDYRRKREHETAQAAVIQTISQADINRGSDNDPQRDVAIRLMKRIMAQGFTFGRVKSEFVRRNKQHNAKWLGAQVLKYRVDWHQLVPSDLQDAPPEPPTTTIAESFNTADSGTLGPDLSWTETANDMIIVSNECYAFAAGGASGAIARAEHDLSSDDHYAQVTITALNASATAGAICRFNSSSNQFYFGALNNGDDKAYLYKYDSGFTLLNTPPVVTPSIPEVWKSSADGSTVSVYQAGTLRDSVTDTSLTGSVRCGIFFYDASGGSTVDNFVAEDIVAGGGAVGPLIGGRLTRSHLIGGRLVA